MKDSALVSAAVDGPMPLSDVIALAERLLAESESHPWTEPYLMLDLARHQALMAGFDSAQDLVVRSRTKLVEIGDDLAMTTLWPEAAALVAVLGGDGRSAEEILVPAIEAAAAREDTAWYAYLEVHRAEAALVAGEIDRALEFAKEAEQESLPGQSWIELYWQAARAKGLARSGRAIEAEECVREPLELYETTDNLLVKGQLRLILSEALALQGKLVDAERAASEAASILTAKGATLFVERAKTMLSGIRNGGTAVTAPPFAG
jgi:tetratricopeptide (TPR) repeat protein